MVLRSSSETASITLPEEAEVCIPFLIHCKISVDFHWKNGDQFHTPPVESRKQRSKIIRQLSEKIRLPSGFIGK